MFLDPHRSLVSDCGISSDYVMEMPINIYNLSDLPSNKIER